MDKVCTPRYRAETQLAEMDAGAKDSLAGAYLDVNSR